MVSVEVALHDLVVVVRKLLQHFIVQLVRLLLGQEGLPFRLGGRVYLMLLPELGGERVDLRQGALGLGDAVAVLVQLGPDLGARLDLLRGQAALGVQGEGGAGSDAFYDGGALAAHGAIVVWQENTSGGNVLRAQHLLATGDVDPAWPVPATVCATSTMAWTANPRCGST